MRRVEYVFCRQTKYEIFRYFLEKMEKFEIMDWITFYDVLELNDQDKYFILSKYKHKITNPNERRIVDHQYFKCIMMSMTLTWEQKYEMMSLMVDDFLIFANTYCPHSNISEGCMFADHRGVIEHFYIHNGKAMDLMKIDDHYHTFMTHERDVYYQFLRQYKCLMNVDARYILPEIETYDSLDISSIRRKMDIDGVHSPFVSIDGDSDLLTIHIYHSDMTSTYNISGSHKRVIIAGNGRLNLIISGRVDLLYICSVTLNSFNIINTPRQVVFNEVYFDRETRKSQGKAHSGETVIFDTKNMEHGEPQIQYVVVYNCISETELLIDGKLVRDFGFFSKDGNIGMVNITKLEHHIFLKSTVQIIAVDYYQKDGQHRSISMSGDFILRGRITANKLSILDDSTYVRALKNGNDPTRDTRRTALNDFFDINPNGIPFILDS